ncbi:PQQ-binding-like beta-propeller repeat protein [Paenibacillus sp. FSL W8-0194]|uniref:outer membrane protein assembly factor BamB family protein n=1 Tax=Paenibacillus sp. FSL W8-0194 TaxID=2921711 RepID=UPI0030DB3C36
MMRFKPLKLLAGVAVLAVSSALLPSVPGSAGWLGSSQAYAAKQDLPAIKLFFRYKTPYFDAKPTSASRWEDLRAADYGLAGEWAYVVPAESGDGQPADSLGGDLAAAATDSENSRWIPRWYTTDAAKSIVETEPAYVTLHPDAELSLAPGSSLKWAPPGQGARFIALAGWRDWTAVMVSPRAWHGEDQMYRPVLLWVNAKAVASKSAIPKGILSRGSAVPVDLARNLTEMLLEEGDAASKVQQLLGTPDVRERSANLAETHEPMRLGTTWRYELPQARFTVTFSPEGKLAAWKWMLPANGRLELNRTAGSDYRFTYDFLTMPIPSTMDVKPAWRNQGNLNYAYLIGATGDVLLVNGDDGGFSGMHYASSIYAVDRDTGKKLWQADAGFGMFGASLDASRGTAAVYTEYDPGREKYEGRIREFRLRDGKVVWEKSLPKERQIRMHAVKGAILLQQTASNGASGVLSVLDRATGKQRWNRALTGKQQVLETGAEDPCILLQDGSKLKALDPLSGKEKWSVQGAGAVQQDPQGNPYFGYGNLRQPLRHDASRWFLIGSEWMLLNTETGKVLGKYPWKPQERFEATNDSRYLLVQRSEGTGDFDHSKVKETVFYDAVLRRSLWTLPGKAANGMIDGNRLYVVLDGRPAAVDREKGTLLWQMPVTSRESSSPYAMDEMAKTRFAVLSRHLVLGYGSDLLVLRKEDGSVLGRLPNQRVDFAEARYRNGIEGLVNQSAGGELYIGSSNGGLSRYEQAELERQLERIDSGQRP